MNKLFAAVVAAGFIASFPLVSGDGAALAQARLSESQACRDITVAALLAAANTSGLSAAVSRLAIDNPGCGRQLVRAVNAVLSQAPVEQRRALADQAAAGFVSAQQALIESGNVSAASSLAGTVAASGSTLLQTAFSAASAGNAVTAGGAGGGRPPLQVGAGNASNNNAVVLTPSSLSGGGGGGGGVVSPVTP